MGCLLLLCLIASLPLLWFFPIFTSVVIGIAWLLLFLIVFGTQRTTRFQVGLLTPDEAEVASQHGFYFRMPFAAANISNGASPWQMFTVVWAIYLGCIGLWWYLPIPIAVHFICAYLRTTCHPIFFAQEGVRLYGGTLQGFTFEAKLQLLTSVYEKFYGNHTRN